MTDVRIALEGVVRSFRRRGACDFEIKTIVTLTGERRRSDHGHS